MDPYFYDAISGISRTTGLPTALFTLCLLATGGSSRERKKAIVQCLTCISNSVLSHVVERQVSLKALSTGS